MANVCKTEAEMYENANKIVDRLLKGGSTKDELLKAVDEYMLRTYKVKEQLAALAAPLRQGKFGGQGARVVQILEGYVRGLEMMVDEAGSATLRAFLYSCPKRADRALAEISKRLRVMEFLVTKISAGIA